MDLGSRAEVFLFDEPISGLSSKDSEHVAETLRSLAREKIVIASLHRPGAPVLRLFDKVLLLDSGGRLAYFGTPAAMVGYFRDACEELAISHPSVAAKSPLGADFVFDVLETPLELDRRRLEHRRGPAFPVLFLAGTIRKRGPDAVAATRRRPGLQDWAISRIRRAPAGAAQARRGGCTPCIAVFATHFLRSLLSKLRNRGTIYSTCLEAPLLAALIAITLRSSPEGSYQFSTALHIPAYLFLSATVAMFLGPDQLGDRGPARPARSCGASGTASRARAPTSMAKFAALGLVAAAQCFAYLVVGNYFLEIDGMLPYHWLWMTLTAWTGTGDGAGGFLDRQNRARRPHRRAAAAGPADAAGGSAGALPGNEPRPVRQRGDVRDRGGMPVPAVRHAAALCLRGDDHRPGHPQSVRIERLRLQRRIDRVALARKPDESGAVRSASNW